MQMFFGQGCKIAEMRMAIKAIRNVVYAFGFYRNTKFSS